MFFFQRTWCVPEKERNTFQAEVTANNDLCRRPTASASPTDVDAALLLEQEVGDVSAVQLQAVLDVSAGPLRRVPNLRIISGEGQLEVAQGAAGGEALQLLSGRESGRRAETVAIDPTPQTQSPQTCNSIKPRKSEGSIREELSSFSSSSSKCVFRRAVVR